EVFVAQAAGAVAMLAAFLEGAGFVTRLGHLAGFPQPKMHAAVALADRLARAIFRFAVSFVRHESLLGGRFPTRSRKFAAEQFIYNSVWRRCFIEGCPGGEVFQNQSCAAKAPAPPSQSLPPAPPPYLRVRSHQRSHGP